MEMGEYALALESALLAVENEKNWSDAHLTLGRVYLNIGELNHASNYMEQALLLTKQQSDEYGRPLMGNSSSMEVEAELDEVYLLIAIQQQNILANQQENQLISNSSSSNDPDGKSMDLS
jgi:Tfp pilus assembly protein PilF